MTPACGHYAAPPPTPSVFGRQCGHLLRLLTGLAIILIAPSVGNAAKPAMSYVLDLRQPRTHLIQVTWTVPEAAPSTEIQFPAWNATYQIRDFVRHVQDLTATCDGKPVQLARVDVDTWHSGQEPCTSLEIHYAVFANEEGPFGSAFDETHAFMNFAMVLFYLPQERGRACRLKILLREGWKLASVLGEPDAAGEVDAADYDELADAPAEAGTFQEYDYEQGGKGGKRAAYRIIVHADPTVYSPDRLLDSVEKITAAETALMDDLPFTHYTFILHFAGRGGGGMEHANGTAITVRASDLQKRWEGFESVVAHEFFHAWNVKRIRPQALEPVDYVHGNDTRDLWFSEGVTSTYGDYTMLRAGLIDRPSFYQRLAGHIRDLQSRPARLTQSLEISGREAWLEKYPDYWRPERSISYYNKGELVGFLLDLALRHATHSRASLDDVLRRLNSDFARRHRFFTQLDLVSLIHDVAPEFESMDRFFADYLTGTREFDYDTYFGYAGLGLIRSSVAEATLGFEIVSRQTGGEVTVESVDANSSAAKAGLQPGDVLVEMDGVPLNFPPQVDGRKPGTRVEFTLHRGGQTRKIKFDLSETRASAYRLEEIPGATADERRFRDDWLSGKTEP